MLRGNSGFNKNLLYERTPYSMPLPFPMVNKRNNDTVIN